METRINPNQVSYIAICDGHKGYKWSNAILEYTFRPTYKHWFWENHPQGYYRKGKPQSSLTSSFRELPEGCYDLNGELWSYPSVSIFSAQKRIKNSYFETLEQAKEWVTNNFPNCNVIIE